MLHETAHPRSGETVPIVGGPYAGKSIWVEDWWDRIAGKSWMVCDGNPACLNYAVASAGASPIDDEVIYGKIGSLGYLVHVSWISPELSA